MFDCVVRIYVYICIIQDVRIGLVVGEFLMCEVKFVYENDIL